MSLVNHWRIEIDCSQICFAGIANFMRFALGNLKKCPALERHRLSFNNGGAAARNYIKPLVGLMLIVGSAFFVARFYNHRRDFGALSLRQYSEPFFRIDL